MGGKGVADPGADEALDPGHAAPNHEGSPEAQPKAGARVCISLPSPAAHQMCCARTQSIQIGDRVCDPSHVRLYPLCRGKKEVGFLCVAARRPFAESVQGAICDLTDRCSHVPCCHVSGPKDCLERWGWMPFIMEDDGWR